MRFKVIFASSFLQWQTFCFILFVFFVNQCASENCLVELPMTKLLKIKKSLDLFTHKISSCSNRLDKGCEEFNDTLEHREDDHQISLDGVQNPLFLKAVDVRRSNEIWADPPSKIQTFFQLSVTGLSFLAFGGYLLCMIVQAIKSKGTTYIHPTTNGNDNTNRYSNIFRKVKVYARSRRNAATTASPENVTTQSPLQLLKPDDLYQTMIYFAEEFVNFS